MGKVPRLMAHPLNDQLSDPVALFYSKVVLAEVEEQNLDRATIIGINDTGANVN